jgi:glycosyltransferase involved in cell wall biosynthesis
MNRGRIVFMADASSVHTQRWVQATAERGFECTVVSRRAAQVEGARVILAHPGSDAIGWFRALGAVRGIAGQLRPDCIHGHYATSYGMWAAACRQYAPVVITAWGSDILVTPHESGWRGSAARAVLRWSLRRADLITADAQAVLDDIERYGSKAPRHEVMWGVDTRRFCPPPERGDAVGFTVVSLRQWEPNYRITIVLRAFAGLCRARPQLRARLALLGGGSQRAELQALAATLRLGDSVHFVGRVDDAGLVAALSEGDVSVSVPASDATSVAMLESMACALPVIATDLPANRPWIDAARRVPVDDVGALTAALVALADDPPGRVALGEANRQAILERASRATHMDRMASLYDSLLSRSRRAA